MAWVISASGELPTYTGAKTVTGTLTVGGQILAIAGTNGAPGISFAAQTTMGMYRIGANQLGFTAAGGGDIAAENAAWTLDRLAVLQWTDGSSFGGAVRDVRLARAGAGQLTMSLGTAGNGQVMGWNLLTELTTILAAATTDTAIQIPANAIAFAVSVRVTTVIPTAATFDVGIAGATTRYGTGLSTAATTTNPGTNDGTRFYSSATAIRFTPNLTPGAATGVVRTTILYLTSTPPIS